MFKCYNISIVETKRLNLKYVFNAGDLHFNVLLVKSSLLKLKRKFMEGTGLRWGPVVLANYLVIDPVMP